MTTYCSILTRRIPWTEEPTVQPRPPPGYLSHPGIQPESLMSPTLTDRLFITSATWEVPSLGSDSSDKKGLNVTTPLWQKVKKT